MRLPDPAPGFPYRVQPDGLYAMTAGAGPACYGAEFVVSTAPTGADGSTATVFVTDCVPPQATDGVIEGHAVVAHTRPVAGVDGAFTRYTTGTQGSTHQNLVLYFTTGHFTTRIDGTALSQDQLLALGNALTGLPRRHPPADQSPVTCAKWEDPFRGSTGQCLAPSRSAVDPRPRYSR